MFKQVILSAVLALCLIGGAQASHAGAGKPAAGDAAASKNIVQVARAAGSFKTLLAAIDAADLTGTLSGQGKGPFTVFAPTDEAFAKLPAGTVQSLLQNPAALRNILLYHVVPGQYLAADVLGASTLTAANGGTLTISAAGGPHVNDAAITATDIRARNGVIHVIDTVLIPR